MITTIRNGGPDSCRMNRSERLVIPKSNCFLLFFCILICNVVLTSQKIGNKPPPILTEVPKTDFSCLGRPAGYYADQKIGCQAYHMCDISEKQFSYLCPSYTLFNQKYMVCDHWHSVDCSIAHTYYDLNLKIGQVPDKNKNNISNRLNVKNINPKEESAAGKLRKFNNSQRISNNFQNFKFISNNRNTSLTTPKPPKRSTTTRIRTTKKNSAKTTKIPNRTLFTTPRTPARNAFSTPRTPARNAFSTPRTPARNAFSTPRTTVRNAFSTPRTLARNAFSTPRTPSRNAFSTPRTPARNAFSTPRTLARNAFSTPRSPARNAFSTPRTTVRNAFSTPRTTVRNAFSTPRTTIRNVFSTPKTIFNTPRSTREKFFFTTSRPPFNAPEPAETPSFTLTPPDVDNKVSVSSNGGTNSFFNLNSIINGFMSISGRGGRRSKLNFGFLDSQEEQQINLKIRPLLKRKKVSFRDQRNFTIPAYVLTTTTPSSFVEEAKSIEDSKEITAPLVGDSLLSFLIPPFETSPQKIPERFRPQTFVSPFLLPPARGPVVLRADNQELRTDLVFSSKVKVPSFPQDIFKPRSLSFTRDNRAFFIPSAGLTPPLDTNSLEEENPFQRIENHMTMTFPQRMTFRKHRPFRLNQNCPQCHPAFLRPNECQPCVIIK